jgi:hypothetical protein
MTRNVVFFRGLALACLMGLSSASTASAAAIPLIDITDDATYSWTWAEDLTLGYEFTLTSSVTVHALAVFDVVSAVPATGHTNVDGLASSHEVGVWDSLGNLVLSATVDPGDPTAPSANSYGQWVYQSITPTTLLAGTYTIGAYYDGGLATSDPVMVQQTAFSNGPAVYVGGRYIYDSAFQQPLYNYPPNEEQYFGPTLFVPDGGMTLTLLGGSMIGLAALRRRFKA